MSAIFFHSEEQRKLALEAKEREQIRRKGKIYTEIMPAGPFYPAEDYHQKYYMRRSAALVKEFNALYMPPDDFTQSTAAARVNAFMGGYGTLDALQSELKELGLPPAAINRMISMLRESGR